MYLLGIITTALALLSINAMIFPRMRGNWRKTTIRMGPVSCAGFACSFTGMSLWQFFPSPPLTVMGATMWVFFALGVILCFVGYLRDVRADRENPQA